MFCVLLFVSFNFFPFRQVTFINCQALQHMQHNGSIFIFPLIIVPRIGPGQSPLFCHLPTFFIFQYLFLFSFLIHASSIFLLFIPSHSTRIVPLHFHAQMSWEATKRGFSFICVDFVLQSNLVISNSDNSNFRLYRDHTLVPATSHCNRWENASDLSNTAISNSRLYRVRSAAPHVSTASVISKSMSTGEI